MKKTICIILLCLPFFSHAQQLSLVGSNFSFAKGNIDVEVLTDVIEQKQDQFMQKVFKDIVIKNFRDVRGIEKSFATYSYIYNTLHTLTAEKNKTVITRQIINNIIEYSLVYGFTQKFALSGKYNLKLLSTKDTSKTYLTGGQLWSGLHSLPSNGSEKVDLKETNESSWVTFNILLDMSYDIFLSDTSNSSLQTKGLFKLLIDNPNLNSWYRQDNAYLLVETQPGVAAVRSQMEAEYAKFKAQVAAVDDISIIYKGLERSNFKQETITEPQFNACKRLLRNGISILKTYSDNNIIGSISEFLLDYTLIEYAPAPGQNGLATQSDERAPDKRGILYIDAEGLIANLYDKFASTDKRSTVSKSWSFLRPRPFFIIGATHSGAFNKGNQLLSDGTSATDLKNIYFANEKLGLKVTFMDRKYTHSFEPGEEFKYRGGKSYWKTPQVEPILSKIEMLVYGSGLLYNIVDIRSQENFNYTLIGSALNFTFFNGLMLNFGVALPVNAPGQLDNKYLYTASFDIPIIEYITAARKKRSR